MAKKGKDYYFEKAIAWVEKRTIASFKANAEGYEKTKVFKNKSSETEIQADLSFITKSGAKHYTDIALKKPDVTDLVTRWKLLSLMAASKNGQLHLLAPKGHKMFTKRLIADYNLDAEIHSL